MEAPHPSPHLRNAALRMRRLKTREAAMLWVRSYLSCVKDLTRLGKPAVLVDVSGSPLATSRGLTSRRGRELMDLEAFCSERNVSVFWATEDSYRDGWQLDVCGIQKGHRIPVREHHVLEHEERLTEGRKFAAQAGYQILVTVGDRHVDVDSLTPVTSPDLPIPLFSELDSMASSMRWALAYLGCVKSLARRPAVVLDIDGTILINQRSGPSHCVRRVHALAQACVENDVFIYCVTARVEDPKIRARTLDQLRQCNISPIRKLFMRPDGDDYLLYKKKARDAIAAEGCQVLLSVGDQFADVTSGRPPPRARDDRFYVGLFEGTTFGIKFPSEFS